MKQLIYLAGPIAGLTYNGAQDWRTEAAQVLDSDKVETLSPMRGKEFLTANGTLGATFDGHVLTSDKGINRRDMLDTCRSTAVLVNLGGAEKVSIGTCMELAWAFMKQIPTIVVMEPGNIHEHAMINDCITYKVSTLEDAYLLVKLLCNDSPKPSIDWEYAQELSAEETFNHQSKKLGW